MKKEGGGGRGKDASPRRRVRRCPEKGYNRQKNDKKHLFERQKNGNNNRNVILSCPYPGPSVLTSLLLFLFLPPPPLRRLSFFFFFFFFFFFLFFFFSPPPPSYCIVLALCNRIVPPTANLEATSPDLHLNYVPKTPQPFPEG